MTAKKHGYEHHHVAKAKTGLEIKSIKVNNPGAGYDSSVVVSFDGGGGSGATAEAVLDANGSVTAIEVTNGGDGYTSAPTVVFTGGGGNYAVATATVG